MRNFSTQAKLTVACALVSVAHVASKLLGYLFSPSDALAGNMLGLSTSVGLCLVTLFACYFLIRGNFWAFIVLALYWMSQALFIHSPEWIWDLGDSPQLAFGLLGSSEEQTSLMIRLIPGAMYLFTLFVLLKVWSERKRQRQQPE